MPKLRSLAVFIAVTLIPLAFASRAFAAGSAYKAQIKEKFRGVNLADGVDEEEAVIIAQNDLIETGDDKNCVISSAKVFGQNDPYWSKDSWHVSFRTAFRERMRSGLKWVTVNVDKKTGKITSGGGGPDL